MTRVVHTGVSRAAAEEAAFERAVASARDIPGSVLFVPPRDVPGDEVEDRWRTVGSPLQLQIQSLDNFVTDVYESAYFETRVRTLSGEERQRLVEAAVDSLAETHPLASHRSTASSETYSQSEELLSLLEFGRLTNPESILDDERLRGLSTDVRTAFYDLSKEFDEARGRLATARGNDSPRRKSIRSERYQTVASDRSSVESALENVDVMVLGGFPFFSPLEADLVDTMAAAVREVRAVLPLAGAAEAGPLEVTSSLTGVDRAAERAWSDYEDLGFRVERAATDADSAGAEVVHRLYRYTERPRLSATKFDEAGIEWYAYPTTAHEVRGTAREIRTRLDTGATPADIGVVTTSPGIYTQEIYETFSQYDLPVRTTREVGLDDTELGNALVCALRIGGGEGTVRDVIRLIDNPLVEPQWPGDPVDSVELVRAGSAVEATDLDALAERLEREEGATGGTEALDWLEARCAQLYEGERGSAVTEVEAALSTLGIASGSTDGTRDEWELLADGVTDGWTGDRERAALRAVRTVLESFVETDPVVDGESSFGERLQCALESATVEPTLGDPDGIELLSPADAIHRQFDAVFVLGLTQENFPSDPYRLAFARGINEADPDFAQSDAALQARYGLGLQLAQATEVILSRPKRTADGDETVMADFLAELDRIGSDEAIEEVEREDFTHPPMSREDVQRRTATKLASLQHRRTETSTEVVNEDEDAIADTVAKSAAFAGEVGDPAERIRHGVACATARRSAQTTYYDGRISPETFQQFEAASTPLSPSRTNTYVTCGFKFYAENVLGYEGEQEHTRELDALDAGTFIHNVVARFFLSVQETPGTPVEIEEPTAYHDEMYAATMTELDRPRYQRHDSAFHDGWLTKLLAGLDPGETENEYDGPEGHRGLLVRLLDSIADETTSTTVRPVLFEAGIGLRDEEPMTILDDTEGDDGPLTVLSPDPVDLSPQSGFKFRGKVDRVDVVPGTDPREFTAVDYKTGSTPSISDIRGGIDFQLPLYLRMLDAALDRDHEWTPIGAAYYKLSLPDSAGIKQSPLASRVHTAHPFASATEPLQRQGTTDLFDYFRQPAQERELVDLSSSEDVDDLDENDVFVDFLGAEFDRRLEQVTDALEDGVFHPTLLGEKKANCEYCDYAHVCDVRHHQREERLDEHGLDTVYVPEAAENSELIEDDE